MRARIIPPPMAENAMYTGRTSTKKLQWLSGKRAPDSRHAVGNDRASRGRQVMMRYLLVQPYAPQPWRGDDR